MSTKPLMQQHEKALEKPFLPDKKVIKAAISINAVKAAESLIAQGIEPFYIDCNPFIKSAVSSHADINIFPFIKKKLYVFNDKSAGELQNYFDIIRVPEIPGTDYPSDALLDCVSIGNKFICNEKTVSKEILESAYESGFEIINVRQGYTKCSVCPVTDDFIITDDPSIYKSVQNLFDDVLFISKDSIRLKGMNYGFIGGASGKIDNNKIAFNGRIESHTDHNLIIDSLSRYHMDIIELTDDPLEDIGSIVPLTEFC